MPLPGETTTESHFFYVPADMVRPREFHRSRPVSVDSDELTTHVVSLQRSFVDISCGVFFFEYFFFNLYQYCIKQQFIKEYFCNLRMVT